MGIKVEGGADIVYIRIFCIFKGSFGILKAYLVEFCLFWLKKEENIFKTPIGNHLTFFFFNRNVDKAGREGAERDKGIFFRIADF